jgi:hypothetical protein
VISFDKPEKLDGGKLIEELLAANVKIAKDDRFPFGVYPPEIDGNNVLWLDIDINDEDTARAVVTAHNG